MKIGIAISSYNNTKKQLIKCLNSIQNQSYRSDLIVTLNGGDTNADLLSERGLNYRVFNDNLGMSGNWNRAIALLNDCEYITFVHADDTICQNHIQVLGDSIRDHDICFASLKLNEPYLKRLAYVVKNNDLNLVWRKRSFTADVTITLKDLIALNTLPVIALIKKETWDRLGGYSHDEIYPDWDLWIRAKKAGCTMTATTIPTYNYTVHSYPQSKEELSNLRTLMREKHGNNLRDI
jgi:glycosyltransferase involved in cell wall biosynthesis